MGGATSTRPEPAKPAGRIHSAAKALGSLALLPLPWPPADAPREARRPHAHRCFDCGRKFRCPGPDETEACAPVCAPCYWVELGRQLRTYRAVIAALNRKRRKIEKNVGIEVCRYALAQPRKPALGGAIIAGLGHVTTVHRERALLEPAATEKVMRLRAKSRRNQLRTRSSRRGALT